MRWDGQTLPGGHQDIQADEGDTDSANTAENYLCQGVPVAVVKKKEKRDIRTTSPPLIESGFLVLTGGNSARSFISQLPLLSRRAIYSTYYTGYSTSYLR